MRNTQNIPTKAHSSSNAHHDIPEFFDVKFYPYNPIGADPVFAAVSKKHVCQLIRLFNFLNMALASFTDAE